MALIKADRVKETSTSTTTANFILGGAATGYRTFSSVCAVGDTFYYAISNQSNGEWEVGLGTYGVPNILERTTVHASSNSGAKVNFSAGTKECFLTLTARHLDRIQDNGQSTAIGSKTSVVAVNDSATLPDLDLQFADLKTLTAKYGPTPSYSRASTGTYFNASGVLTSAAVNEPRFDHVLENGAWVSKGLLIEEQKTNYAKYANDLSTNWINESGATREYNSVVSPDGGTNATKINVAVADFSGIYQFPVLNAGPGIYTYSIFAKKGTKNWLWILNASGSGGTQTSFNISNGTLGTVNSGYSASIIDCGNGWYRCILTTSTTTPSWFQLGFSDSNNSVTPSSTGYSYVYGAQIEVGSFATSFISNNTSSSVTRSADVCQITGSAFTNLWNATEGSFAADWDARRNSTGQFTVYWARDAASSNTVLHTGRDALSPPGVRFTVVSGSSISAEIINAGFPEPGVQTRTAGCYKANDFAYAYNGVLVGTDTSGSVPVSPVDLLIGYDPYTSWLNGHISRLRYFRSRLDNTQLVNLSGGINTLAFKPVTGSGSVTVANEYTGINISVPNPLPITNGGTGAQTQLNAVTNLVGNPPNDGGQYTLASKKTSGTPTFYWVDSTGYAPTLDLLFAADKSLTAYKGPTPTFSRASSGSYFDSVGVLRYSNVNLITYSEQFDNAAWTDRVGSTLTTNVVASPNGDLTADQIQLTSSGFYYQKKAYTTTGSHTFSIWIRSISPTTVTLRLSNDAGTESATVNCNVTTSWQRFSVTRNWTSNPVNFYAGIDQRTVVGGVGTEANIYVWGAQLEVGSSATQYTKTEASTNAAPRFNHTFNGTSWVSRGLLVEEQRTNLATYSEDLSHSSWIKIDTTISTNIATAPDGTQTADLIYPTTSGDYRVAYKAPASTNGQTYTISLFAKASGINWISIPDASGGNMGARFNLSNGTIGTVVSGITAAIQNYGNGWYRCSVTLVSGAGGTVYIGATITDDGSGTYVTKNGTNGVLIWGAQVELGAFPTSYIGTTNSSVVRSADVCQITGGDFSGFWNASEGTFAVDFDRLSPLTAGGVIYPRTLWVGDGAAGNFINHYSNHASPYDEQFTMYSGGALQFAFSGYVNSGISLQKYALAFKNNDSAVSNNGGAVQTDNTCTVPTVPAQMSIGYLYGSTNYLNGHISRLRYYPVRLPNATLQVLST